MWSGRENSMFLSESAHPLREGKELSVDRICYLNFAKVAVELDGVRAVTVLSALQKVLCSHPVLCNYVG